MSRWAQCHWKGLYKTEVRGSIDKRRCDSGSRGRSEAVAKKGATKQGMQWPLKVGKGKEINSP